MPTPSATHSRHLFLPDLEPHRPMAVRPRRRSQRRLKRSALVWALLLAVSAVGSQLVRRPAGTAAAAATLAPYAIRRAPAQVAGWRTEVQPATIREPGTRRPAESPTSEDSDTWIEVWATAYCPTCRVCDTGKITKSGRHAWSRGLAVAARGRKVAPLGSRIYVPRFGWLPVDDTGGAVRSNQIDIRLKSHRRAVLFGRRRMRVRLASR